MILNSLDNFNHMSSINPKSQSSQTLELNLGKFIRKFIPNRISFIKNQSRLISFVSGTLAVSKVFQKSLEQICEKQRCQALGPNWIKMSHVCLM